MTVPLRALQASGTPRSIGVILDTFGPRLPSLGPHRRPGDGRSWERPSWGQRRWYSEQPTTHTQVGHWYEALGKPPGTPRPELKTAFYTLSMQIHPDKFPKDLPEKEKALKKDRFYLAIAAYEGFTKLSDEDKKEIDRQILEEKDRRRREERRARDDAHAKLVGQQLRQMTQAEAAKTQQVAAEGIGKKRPGRKPVTVPRDPGEHLRKKTASKTKDETPLHSKKSEAAGARPAATKTAGTSPARNPATHEAGSAGGKTDPDAHPLRGTTGADPRPVDRTPREYGSDRGIKEPTGEQKAKGDGKGRTRPGPGPGPGPEATAPGPQREGKMKVVILHDLHEKTRIFDLGQALEPDRLGPYHSAFVSNGPGPRNARIVFFDGAAARKLVRSVKSGSFAVLGRRVTKARFDTPSDNDYATKFRHRGLLVIAPPGSRWEPECENGNVMVALLRKHGGPDRTDRFYEFTGYSRKVLKIYFASVKDAERAMGVLAKHCPELTVQAVDDYLGPVDTAASESARKSEQRSEQGAALARSAQASIPGALMSASVWFASWLRRA